VSQPTDDEAVLSQREAELDALQWTLALQDAQLRGQSQVLARRGEVVAQRAQWLDQRGLASSGPAALGVADPDGWVACAAKVQEGRRALAEARHDWLMQQQKRLDGRRRDLEALDEGLGRVETRLEECARQVAAGSLAQLATAASVAPAVSVAVPPARPASAAAAVRARQGSSVVVPAVPTRQPSRTDVAELSPPLQPRPVSKRLTERPLFRPAEVRPGDVQPGEDELPVLATARPTDTSIQPRTKVVVDVLSDVLDPRHAPTMGLPGSQGAVTRDGAAMTRDAAAARHAHTDPVLATLMLADVPLARGQIEVDRVTRTLLVTLPSPPLKWPPQVLLVGQRPDGQRLQWRVEVRRTLPAPPRGTLVILALQQPTPADLQALQRLVDQLG
jgi:hypothetical protein